MITILSEKDEHCWIGELNGLHGWFPAKFVEVIDNVFYRLWPERVGENPKKYLILQKKKLKGRQRSCLKITENANPNKKTASNFRSLMRKERITRFTAMKRYTLR